MKLPCEKHTRYIKIRTFNPSDSLQEFTVPANATSIEVDCIAPSGNAGVGGAGYGGRVKCTLAVTAGQKLYFYVGSAGTGAPVYNASDIRTNKNGVTDTTSLQSRLVVAGGGGNGDIY